MSAEARRNGSSLLGSVALVVSALATCGMLSGCIVAGVSSSGGWFLWPGGLGLIVVVLLILFLLRRR